MSHTLLASVSLGCVGATNVSLVILSLSSVPLKKCIFSAQEVILSVLLKGMNVIS